MLDTSIHRESTSLFERLWTGMTLFFLAFTLPDAWFVPTDFSADVETANATATMVFLGLFGLVFARLGGTWVNAVKGALATPALLFFSVVVLMSPLWSEASSVSGRRAISVTMTTLFAAAVYARLDRRQFLLLLARVLMAGAVLNLVWAFALPNIGGGENWGGVWDLKNVLGRVSGLSAVILILAAREERQRRLFFYAGAGLCLFLVLQSNSTTSFVGTIGVIGLIVVYSAFRSRKTLFGAVLLSLALGMALSYLAATANLAWITEQLGKDVTLTGRTLLWQYTVDEIVQKPFLGHGFGTFWQGYFSPAHDIWVSNRWRPPHGHNVFIDLMLDLGLLGTIPFVYVVIQGVSRGVRLLRVTPGTAAMFPLVFLSFLLLFSATEAGPVGRNMLWVIFVYVILDLGEVSQELAEAEAEATSRDESLRSDLAVPSA